MPHTVVIAEIKQETNTSASPTTLKDFEDFHLYLADQIRVGLGKSNSEIAGFLEILDKEDVIKGDDVDSDSEEEEEEQYDQPEKEEEEED